MKLNGIETTSAMEKITAILELLVPLMIIGLVALQIFINYRQMQKMERTQQIIILKQQQAIKKANTIADVGENGRKEKEKLPFTNNTEINSMEQNQ